MISLFKYAGNHFKSKEKSHNNGVKLTANSAAVFQS